MDRAESSSVQLKVRVKERTRAILEQAAKENEQPLNKEIASRLEDSIRQESELGGRRTASFLRLVATTIEDIEAATGKAWHDDYATWHAVRAALPTVIDDILKRNRPIAPNAEKIAATQERLSRLKAAGEVLEAAPTMIQRLIEAGTGQPPVSEAHRGTIEEALSALEPARAEQRKGAEVAQRVLASKNER